MAVVDAGEPAHGVSDIAHERVPARFEVIAELGRGGMGVVHEVRDERGVALAIKGLRNLRPREILRIKDEFRALRDIQHPNLCRLGELFEDSGRWYFTMELVTGVDFLRWVRPEDPARGSLPPARLAEDPPSSVTASVQAPWAEPAAWVSGVVPREEPGDAPTTTVAPVAAALAEATSATRLDRPAPRRRAASPTLTGLAEDAEPAAVAPPEMHLRPAPGFDEARLRSALAGIADGLSALHRAGLVHRDIKPSNLRIEAAGRVVLLDFGVVASLERPDDEIVGTLAYMAPEQAAGQVSPAVDWYAVGVMLYRALTGRLPSPGSREGLRQRMRYAPVSPHRLTRDLPPDLVDLCMRLLERDPHARAGEPELRAALGATGAASVDAPWWRTAPSLPFVGRADELIRLRDIAAARATDRRARCVVITGASGIGKTAVVHHFLRELASADPDTVVLQGRCDQRELVPYNALDGVVDDLARRLGRDPGLAEHPPPGTAELAQLFPVLATALGVAADPAPVARGAIERDAAAAALAELLRRVTDQRQVVLFIDDLHWADADSTALVAELLAGPRPPPVLVVATSRERAASCHAVRALRLGVDEVALTGLGDTDVRRLVDAVVPGAARLDADAIARDAAGHPMFVAELARFAAERRAATGTLDQVLWERANGLDAPVRRFLAAVVTAGAPIDLDLAVTAADLGPDVGARAVHELRTARLVRVTRRDDRDVVEPYHDRVAEAVSGRLPPGERGDLHRRLAAALAAAHAPPEPLAYHLAAAGERAAAAVHAELAATRAAAALAFDRAAEWYAMALDHGSHDGERRHGLLVARGDMLVRAGRPRDAARAYLDAAAGDGLDAVAAAELRRRAFEQYLVGGFLTEGVAVAEGVLADVGLALPSSPKRVIARLVWHQLKNDLSPLRWTARDEAELSAAERVRLDACWSAVVGLALVDSLRSAAYSARLTGMCLAAGEPFRIGRALASGAVSAACFSHTRRLARMEAAINRALTESSQPGVRVYRSIAQVARAFFFDNDWSGSIRLVERAIADWHATAGGAGWEGDVLDMFLAWSLAAVGDHGRLKVHVDGAIRSAQRTGNRFREVGFRCQFPQRFLIDDRPDDARADVDDAFAAWQVPAGLDSIGNPFFFATKSRTIIAMYRGTHDEDPAPFEDAWQRLEHSLLVHVPAIRMEVALWRGCWRISRARRHPAQAKELLARAARDARRVKKSAMAVGPAQGQVLEAAIAHARGDLDTAIDGLTRLLPHFERRGMIGPLAAARWHLGTMVGGDAGTALRAEATTALRAVGVANPERLVHTAIPGWDG
jgi:CheY-like chemotaxis protein